MDQLSQSVTIAEGGRIVIPARYRKGLGLCVGDSAVVRVEDGELRIHSIRQGIRKAQAIFARYAAPGPSMSDELLAERRAEAANE